MIKMETIIRKRSKHNSTWLVKTCRRSEQYTHKTACARIDTESTNRMDQDLKKKRDKQIVAT